MAVTQAINQQVLIYGAILWGTGRLRSALVHIGTKGAASQPNPNPRGKPMPEALTTAEIEAAEVAIIEAITENPKLTIKAAVERAGISRTTYYRLRAYRKGFAQRIDEAQAAARQAACDDLEEFLYSRAEDPKNPTGVTAGIFLLKGLKPATYGDRVPKGGTGPINVYIDKAQIALERETSREMRWLEADEEERAEMEREDRRAVELALAAEDAWAVRN